ncbi:hypothetical protein PoB_006171100 [Plakobranchus ocellatus]|uniref:Uncharacterized protein n=1 Tax=Plakobranchus ocellatus TaxID=259542 RepID=A0AAV4CU26_9GAST|nr:hypothetical protein PoB_006171100 [Plakobranchus ocellatus]
MKFILRPSFISPLIHLSGLGQVVRSSDEGLAPDIATRLATHLHAIRIASSQQGDLRLSGPPTSQDDDDGARTRNRRVSADFRVDSLATEPPTPKLFGSRQIRTRA